MVKTKIICTLGPSSSSAATLRKMMRSGMDVVRLNFSHGTHHDHQARINLIRELNRKNKRHIKILGDLEGYRIRIGRIKDKQGLFLKKGQQVWLTKENIIGEKNVLPFDYTGPLGLIKNGSHIYIDDGNIVLVAEGFQNNAIKAKVVVGGPVKEHKGINIPDVKLSFKGVTEKDIVNLGFCLKNKLDFIAQSFVRNSADIQALKDHIPASSYQPLIIAKIENRDGIRNIDPIMASCDAIMIARGDMGVSLPAYEVPMLQKMIIRKCNRAKKTVITATQMLESMTENARPTRAEVSDVANAILDGTDYVMLSAETAAGAYPAECVSMMEHIIRFTEENRLDRTFI